MVEKVGVYTPGITDKVVIHFPRLVDVVKTDEGLFAVMTRETYLALSDAMHEFENREGIGPDNVASI